MSCWKVNYMNITGQHMIFIKYKTIRKVAHHEQSLNKCTVVNVTREKVMRVKWSSSLKK